MESSIAKTPVKLTKANELEFFNKPEIKPGTVFNYSMSFMPDCIKALAENHGVEVEYCPPKTKEYEKYGCMAMKVVSMGEEARIRRAAKKMMEEEIKKMSLNVHLNTDNLFGESSLNIKVSLTYNGKTILEDETSESINITIS